MIAYIKDKKEKSREIKRLKNPKNTILRSTGSIVILGATSTSISLFITGFALIIIPMSASKACGLSLGNILLY